jgi:hypothetical protein
MFYLRALSVCAMIGWTLGSRWDTGLDGDLLGEALAPTEAPNGEMKPYHDLLSGSSPLSGAPGITKQRCRGMEGRLYYRRVSIATPFIHLLLLLTRREK